MEQAKYDVLIAGAGIAGILAALRLRSMRPNISILMLERLSICGGKLRSSFDHPKDWGIGFNAMTQDLYEFLLHSLPMDPDREEPGQSKSLNTGRQMDVGILSGHNIVEIPVREIFTAKGIKALAGQAAVEDWKQWQEALQFSEEEEFLPLTKKLKL